MSVDGELAAPDPGHKADPWRKVAEFSLEIGEPQSSNALNITWEELVRACPPSLRTERLRATLQSTLVDSLRRLGADLAPTVTVVISCLSSRACFSPTIDPGVGASDSPAVGQATLPTATDGESWGFFIVDRPAALLHSSSSLEHTIEICFYCE